MIKFIKSLLFRSPAKEVLPSTVPGAGNCPSCGSGRLDLSSACGTSTYAVRCLDCHARGRGIQLHLTENTTYDTRQELVEQAKRDAIAAWNSGCQRMDMNGLGVTFTTYTLVEGK